MKISISLIQISPTLFVVGASEGAVSNSVDSTLGGSTISGSGLGEGYLSPVVSRRMYGVESSGDLDGG